MADEATPHGSVGSVLGERLRDAVRRAGWASTGVVVLIGAPAVVETALDEVLNPLPGEWRHLWRPSDAGALLAGLRAAEPPAPWTVIRLGDLRRFLLPEDPELTVELAATLRSALARRGDRPLLVVASMPPDPEAWRLLTQGPASGGEDLFAQARALLRQATVLAAPAPAPAGPTGPTPGPAVTSRRDAWWEQVTGAPPEPPAGAAPPGQPAEAAPPAPMAATQGPPVVRALAPPPWAPGPAWAPTLPPPAPVTIPEPPAAPTEAAAPAAPTAPAPPAAPAQPMPPPAGPVTARPCRPAPARDQGAALVRWQPSPQQAGEAAPESPESLRARAQRRERAGDREGADRLYEAAAHEGDLVALARLAVLRAGELGPEADRMFEAAAAEGNTAVLFGLAAAGHGRALRLLATLREEAERAQRRDK